MDIDTTIEVKTQYVNEYLNWDEIEAEVVEVDRDDLLYFVEGLQQQKQQNSKIRGFRFNFQGSLQGHYVN